MRIHLSRRQIHRGLESRKGSQPFFMEHLSDILPKALRAYEKTLDPELEQLLKESVKVLVVGVGFSYLSSSL